MDCIDSFDCAVFYRDKFRARAAILYNERREMEPIPNLQPYAEEVVQEDEDLVLDSSNDDNIQQNAVENIQPDFLFVACDGDQAGEQQQYEFEQETKPILPLIVLNDEDAGAMCDLFSVNSVDNAIEDHDNEQLNLIELNDNDMNDPIDIVIETEHAAMIPAHQDMQTAFEKPVENVDENTSIPDLQAKLVEDDTNVQLNPMEASDGEACALHKAKDTDSNGSIETMRDNEKDPVISNDCWGAFVPAENETFEIKNRKIYVTQTITEDLQFTYIIGEELRGQRTAEYWIKMDDPISGPKMFIENVKLVLL